MSSGDDSVTFPLKEFLGFDLVHGEGTATARLEIGEQHRNPNGVAHGAVAFALMDTAMGAATMTVVPEGGFCATIEMHTRFLRPATAGSLIATAEIISAGKRVVHLSAVVVADDGTPVASATSSYAVIVP